MATERLSMRKTREILRLKYCLGVSDAGDEGESFA